MEPGKLCVIEQSHSSKIIMEKLSAIYKNKELFDVKLQSHGQHFSAHKEILSKFSDFFLHIFKDNSCETPAIINLRNTDPRVIEQMLTYVYEGTIILREDEFASFINFTKMIQIDLRKMDINFKNYTMEELSPKQRKSVQSFRHGEYGAKVVHTFKHNGFIFHEILSQSKIAHWRCSAYNNDNMCQVFCTTYDGVFVSQTGEHKHIPDYRVMK